MSFFIVFIIWYNFFGKSNPKIYRSLQDKIGKIFGVLILFSIISSMSFKFLIGSMVALLILGVACAPFVLLYKILKKIFSPIIRGATKIIYTIKMLPQIPIHIMNKITIRVVKGCL